MKVVYIRVSTVEQNTARQEEAARREGAEKIFVDKVSGKNTDRPQLKEMLDFVREGDEIIVESFSRLARNTKDLLELIEKIHEKGATVRSLKENFDTATPTGKLLLTMIGAIATFERDIMLQRQAEGIAIAKAEGRYCGRAKNEKPEEWDMLYGQYARREMTATALAERCRVSRPTVYKWIRQEKNLAAGG